MQILFSIKALKSLQTIDVSQLKFDSWGYSYFLWTLRSTYLSTNVRFFSCLFWLPFLFTDVLICKTLNRWQWKIYSITSFVSSAPMVAALLPLQTMLPLMESSTVNIISHSFSERKEAMLILKSLLRSSEDLLWFLKPLQLQFQLQKLEFLILFFLLKYLDSIAFFLCEYCDNW